MQETWAGSLDQEEGGWSMEWLHTPVFLPGESPWTEEPGGPQSMGLQRVKHNWATNTYKKTICINCDIWHFCSDPIHVILDFLFFFLFLLIVSSFFSGFIFFASFFCPLIWRPITFLIFFLNNLMYPAVIFKQTSLNSVMKELNNNCTPAPEAQDFLACFCFPTL